MEAKIQQVGIVLSISESETRYVPIEKHGEAFIQRLMRIRVNVTGGYEGTVIEARDDGKHGWLVFCDVDPLGPPKAIRNRLETAIRQVWNLYSGVNFTGDDTRRPADQLQEALSDTKHVIRTLHAEGLISDEDLEEALTLGTAVISWKRPGEIWDEN